MAKSRVEKNKSLYDELESEEFELEDISSSKVEKKEKEQLPVKVEKQEKVKKHEVVPVKKRELIKVSEKKKKKKKNIIDDEDFVVEQPISYTDKLSVEEILRLKLEKQQQLKKDKKIYKRTPITKTYTAEMMQKNINQKDGVDVRKEVNLEVASENKYVVPLLLLLIVAVIVAGAVIALVILK